MKNKAIQFFFLASFSILFSFCNEATYTQGKSLYNFHCANCHSEDGSGLRELYPPLVNSDFLDANEAALPCIIRNGLEGDIIVNGVTYSQPMAGNKVLNDVEINNIINYINIVLRKKKQFTQIDQVKAALEICD